MSVTSRSGETLHLLSTLHPITFSARQPLPSTTHLWLSLMTERASLVALDVDQLLIAWRRFTWLLTRCSTLVYWQMEPLFAQNHELIIGGPSATNPASAVGIFCYYSRAIWHGLMTLKHCLILWLAILSFTYTTLVQTHTHTHTHTHQISSKSSTWTGEKRERIRNMGQRALQSIPICYSASGTFILWCC